MIEGILEHEGCGGHRGTQLIRGYRGTLGTQLVWEHREMGDIWGHEGYRQYGNMRDIADRDGEGRHMGVTVTRGHRGIQEDMGNRVAKVTQRSQLWWHTLWVGEHK